MAYCSGRDLEHLRKYANFAGLEKTATACGEKLPNGWGLFDMHGNVWEWCHDWHGRYGSEDAMNPFGPSEGHFRVLRGGCWSSTARGARSACLNYYEPGLRLNFVGFRCAQSSSDKPPEAKSAVK
jgi:formylglycine-generating enzyme required for sulfatase activity